MKIYLSKREAADPQITTRLEAAGYECVAFSPPPYPLRENLNRRLGKGATS